MDVNKLKKHLMTAISYLIPYVASSGMLMVFGNLFGGQVVDVFSSGISVPSLMTSIGATALGFIPIVISAGISYSIADKAGIAPGVILGLLCKVNGYGFLGGLISGFLTGYITVWLLTVLKVPRWLQGLLPQLILPFIAALVIGLAMQYVIGVPITMLTASINNLLRSLSADPSGKVLFGAVVGVLSAVDYGGPINKVVFTLAVGFQSEGFGGPIANLIQASMIAPFGLTLGYILSKLMGKKLFSKQEGDAVKTAFVMGCFQITEGSFPIILNDVIRITICTALGSAVSGALCGYFDVASSVPSGGFLAIPGINNPAMWLLALAAGSIVFAIALLFLKHTPEEQVVQTSDEDIDLGDLQFSEV